MEKIQWNHLIQTTVGIGVTALTGACCSRLVAPLSRTKGALIPLVGIIAKELLGLQKDLNVPKQALITFSATSVVILSYSFSKGANLNITSVFLFSVGVTAANTAVNFFFTHFYKNSGNTVAANKIADINLKPQDPPPFSAARTFRATLGEERYNKTRKEILDCPEVDYEPAYGGGKNEWCNAIFPGIFLGSALACGCLVKKETFKQAGFNPASVKFVISLCSFADTIGQCCGEESSTLTSEEKYQVSPAEAMRLSTEEINRMDNARADECEAKFAQILKEFTWWRAGEGLDDKPESWKLLVARNSEGEQYPEHPEDRFSTTFSLLDGVFLSDKEGSVLIHCKVGQSRSSTLLIAWVISRFEVSAEQAQKFLRFKRPCVKSKFIDELENYEQDLKNARHSVTS